MRRRTAPPRTHPSPPRVRWEVHRRRRSPPPRRPPPSTTGELDDRRGWRGRHAHNSRAHEAWPRRAHSRTACLIKIAWRMHLHPCYPHTTFRGSNKIFMPLYYTVLYQIKRFLSVTVSHPDRPAPYKFWPVNYSPVVITPVLSLELLRAPRGRGREIIRGVPVNLNAVKSQLTCFTVNRISSLPPKSAPNIPYVVLRAPPSSSPSRT